MFLETKKCNIKNDTMYYTYTIGFIIYVGCTIANYVAV